ncbi:MAG: DUF4411 family protein [Rhizobiaceae bacterium]
MGGDDKIEYVVDASSWIFIEDNPAQNLILAKLGELIEDCRVYCPIEAWNEVKKCAKVQAWLSQYETAVVKRIVDTQYLLKVGVVAHKFPMMSGARGTKEKADAYVVAMAAYLNGISNPTVHVVVHEESTMRKPSRKIGNACKEMGVQHLSLWQMLRKEFPNEQWL